VRVRIIELEHQLEELRAELKLLKTARQPQPKVKSA
jgi:serine O-acetyltransferase